ncbi:MAG: hypothetical protein EXS42_03940 [Lacunisphaera sp.]|nr:hypothetical protein [Lacunisphaera sp.]
MAGPAVKTNMKRWQCSPPAVQPFQKLPGRQDPNALMSFQTKQVSVAAGQVLGLCSYGSGKSGITIRVAADWRSQRHRLHQLGAPAIFLELGYGGALDPELATQRGGELPQ